MVRYRSLVTLTVLLLVAACALPGTSPSPAQSGAPSAVLPSAVLPSAAGSLEPGSSVSEPPATPSPSAPEASPSPDAPSPTPTAAPTPVPTATPSTPPTPVPTETMTVRAYYFLADQAGGDPGLVPVLRKVPLSRTVAAAAVTALLAGPTTAEMAADPGIGTLIPAGTQLLGIQIAGGLATVDLSGTFASGSGSFSVEGRLAQVVYTVTQFPTVDRVRFELDGVPVTVFSSEGIVLDKPVTRATYQDDFLPPIFVDSPVWGSTLANPGPVRGLANVFEAQFRIALIAHNGRSLLDRPVMATCGTGCWGTFDVTMTYSVSSSQWGTLRVWDPSEKDGSAQSVREYPVYLRATP
jgi:germination protein M